MELRSFSKEFKEFGTSRMIFGHQVIINDPALTLSVLEPQMIGGCSLKTREIVSISADQRHCLFAANAGFFNVTDGSCLGKLLVHKLLCFCLTLWFHKADILRYWLYGMPCKRVKAES